MTTVVIALWNSVPKATDEICRLWEPSPVYCVRPTGGPKPPQWNVTHKHSGFSQTKLKVQSKGRPNTTKDINKNLSEHHSNVQTTSEPSNIATKNNLWSLNFDFLCKGNDFQRRVLKNMVWYCQQLQFVKFPLLVPFLHNWKSDTWQWATSWTFTWDFSSVTCSMTCVWLACSAKRMNRTSPSVQGTGEPAVLRPPAPSPRNLIESSQPRHLPKRRTHSLRGPDRADFLRL